MRHELFIISKLLIGFFVVLLFCAYMIYYFAVMQCNWPSVITDSSLEEKTVLRAAVLTDVNLLGASEKSGFTKWRREWQMYQVFHDILHIHKPDVLFILGNLLHEGAWLDDEAFYKDMMRFYEFFASDIEMYVVAGIQDIGFHNQLKPETVKRFNTVMNTSDVRHLSLKGSNIILINSVGLYGDKCSLCNSTRKKIEELSEKLNRIQNSVECKINGNCNRPVVMQYFPLFRESDKLCSGPDLAPFPNRLYPFFPHLTSLSKESSEYLMTKLKPRAVFGSNIYGCFINHTLVTGNETIELMEITVPDFNWRYRHDPKYFLVVITPAEVTARSCDLPTEFTMSVIAFILLLIAIIGATFSEIKAYVMKGFKK